MTDDRFASVTPNRVYTDPYSAHHAATIEAAATRRGWTTAWVRVLFEPAGRPAYIRRYLVALVDAFPHVGRVNTRNSVTWSPDIIGTLDVWHVEASESVPPVPNVDELDQEPVS